MVCDEYQLCLSVTPTFTGVKISVQRRGDHTLGSIPQHDSYGGQGYLLHKRWKKIIMMRKHYPSVSLHQSNEWCDLHRNAWLQNLNYFSLKNAFFSHIYVRLKEINKNYSTYLSLSLKHIF